MTINWYWIAGFLVFSFIAAVIQTVVDVACGIAKRLEDLPARKRLVHQVMYIAVGGLFYALFFQGAGTIGLWWIAGFLVFFTIVSIIELVVDGALGITERLKDLPWRKRLLHEATHFWFGAIFYALFLQI